MVFFLFLRFQWYFGQFKSLWGYYGHFGGRFGHFLGFWDILDIYGAI